MIRYFFLGMVLFSFVSIYSATAIEVSQIHSTKDTLIDAGGHKLHFVVTKAGEPVILLEAGGGADATQWEEIQQRLAKGTNATIISYDRAGYGKSELPNTPYNIKQEIQDLHKCLQTLGVNKMILVAHSYGAFLSQAYQFMYPESVKEIVLVDPNNVIFVDSIGVKILMQIPFDTTKALTITQKADVRQTIAFPNTIETLRNMPYLKTIPITVISAGKEWWPFPQWNRWWRNSQQSIVNLQQNRTFIMAEGSAHNIPKEEPDIIVQAIMKALKKAQQ
jgi:pimeloyl-ACP methyl ester carboxylesterase